MFSHMQEQIFNINKEIQTYPRTPTLPGLQELSPERKKSLRQRNLIINTNCQKNPIAKNRTYRKTDNNDSPVRRNLLNDFDKQIEPYSSIIQHTDGKDVSSTVSNRSMSTSANDRGKHYMNEINTLNNKIRNLIKEQDNLRDKIITQENTIMSLQKDQESKYMNVYQEIQSATIPQHESLTDPYFQITFKPQDRWIKPNTKRFPREIFCKHSKNRLSC